MSFRKEKKYRVSVSDFHIFKGELLANGMSPMFEPRTVHSIYFDTLNFKMFNESEEGTLPRRKLRIRWYNNTPYFTLETKISSIEGRFKTTKILNNIICIKDICRQRYFDNHYGHLFPTLKVNYERSYYTYKSMRITFDDKITYQSRLSNFTSSYVDPERVIEIKIPDDCGEDYLEGQIHNPTSRFSKYSRGLLLSSGSAL